MDSKCDKNYSTENISESLSSSSNINDDYFNQLFMCSICLCRMSSPCCLPCAHSFCRSCLIAYAQNNNQNTTADMYCINCLYCSGQFNFHSYEHFKSMLIVNPILKELCEILDTSKINFDQPEKTQTNESYQARCHTCGLLQTLKICKHCQFMLCGTCRHTHLLEVHRESKLQVELLESRINIINKTRVEMDERSNEYDSIRRKITNYAQHYLHEIEKQCFQAFQILNEQQISNHQAFLNAIGFDSEDNLNEFISFIQVSEQKLSAETITDKELFGISKSLKMMTDANNKLIEPIPFTQFSLKLDETFSTKTLIHIHTTDDSPNDNDVITNSNEQTD